MVQSRTEISNIALSHLGVGKEISDLDSDGSQEAISCRRFYDTALETTLSAFDWPFATKFAALALVEEDPTDEWAYSYRYPSDALYIRRILSGIRRDNTNSVIPYKIARDSTGLLIYTDMDSPDIEYTIRAPSIGAYPSDFVMAFSYYLASLVAPRLAQGDRLAVKKAMLEMYQFEIHGALARARNEERADMNPEAESIRAREGVDLDRDSVLGRLLTE